MKHRSAIGCPSLVSVLLRVVRRHCPLLTAHCPLVLGLVIMLVVAACAPALPPTPTPAPAKPGPVGTSPAPAVQPTPARSPAAATPTAAPTPAAKPAAAVSPTAAPAAAKPGAREAVSFMLDFRASGSQAPIYLAREKGYFADQGLDVEIIESSGSANTARIVAAGSSQIGRVDGGVIIQSVAEGLPIKVIAGLIQTSPLSVFVPKASGITTPKGLEGKKLAGTAGGAAEVLLPAWLKQNGADPTKVQLVSVSSAARQTTFIQGQVDGAVGFVYSDGPLYRDRGLDVHAIRYVDFGFNVPGISLVVNEGYMKQKPEVVRRFLTAAFKGFADAQRDPQAAVQVILKQASALNAKLEVAGLTGFLELLHSKRTQGKPMGWMAVEDWEDGINLLAAHAGLKSKPRAEEMITNQFIPAQ